MKKTVKILDPRERSKEEREKGRLTCRFAVCADTACEDEARRRLTEKPRRDHEVAGQLEHSLTRHLALFASQVPCL